VLRLYQRNGKPPLSAKREKGGAAISIPGDPHVVGGQKNSRWSLAQHPLFHFWRKLLLPNPVPSAPERIAFAFSRPSRSAQRFYFRISKFTEM
jgi:hypothetical protein